MPERATEPPFDCLTCECCGSDDDDTTTGCDEPMVWHIGLTALCREHIAELIDDE